MRRFTYDVDRSVYQAEDAIEGFLINPKFPAKFNSTANDARPKAHQKFWNLPYIESFESADPKAVEGKVYQVHCLDGGAWDRPTMWGGFFTLMEAVECCKTGPAWRKKNTAKGDQNV
jgi:hypothetical protein